MDLEEAVRVVEAEAAGEVATPGVGRLEGALAVVVKHLLDSQASSASSPSPVTEETSESAENLKRELSSRLRVALSACAAQSDLLDLWAIEDRLDRPDFGAHLEGLVVTARQALKAHQALKARCRECRATGAADSRTSATSYCSFEFQYLREEEPTDD